MRTSNVEFKVIDWRITSVCNFKCKYCYASAPLTEMSDIERQKVLNNIVSSGCKTVCISGGEPLLSKNALPIIRYLHNHGIAIYLSTNGTEYMKHREELEKYIDKLSLSLDGYDIESNGINDRCLKNPKASELDSFSVVKNILDYYETHEHRFAIKVGTVLTRRNLNIEHFKRIFEFLQQYSIDLWKVYEFIPEGRGLSNYENLCISDEERMKFIQDFKI